MYESMPATVHERKSRLEEEIIVFKCGGSSVDDLSKNFFQNIRALQQSGKKPVIVHGGGPAIEKLLNELNISYTFIDGLRKTTDEMMDVVEMVLTGQVNPVLTRKFNAHHIQDVGLSGSDGYLLQAEAVDEQKYGQVGQLVAIDTTVMEHLLEENIVPVISPVAINKDNKRLNVNADTAAGAVASALHAKQLVIVTDVPGILKDGELIETVTTEEIYTMMEDGTIYGGMIPKVKAAMKGLQGNVQEVMIVNGKDSEMKDEKTLAGTVICHQEKAYAHKSL